MEIYRPVSGVTLDRNQARVVILKVPDQPGIAGKIFGSLADHHITVDMIIQAFHQQSSVNDITFTIKGDDLPTARKVMEEVKTEVGAEAVLTDEDVAKVSIVGAKLMDTPDNAARMFGELGRNGINIKMISTSDIRISCVISDTDAEKAVRLIHDLFHLEDSK